MTKIIRLNDDINVEVEIDDNQAQEISHNSNVDNSISEINSLLTKVMKPIGNTYQKLEQDINIDSIKVAVGIKIGIEGSIILAKSKASANIQVEMIIKPTQNN